MKKHIVAAAVTAGLAFGIYQYSGPADVAIKAAPGVTAEALLGVGMPEAGISYSPRIGNKRGGERKIGTGPKKPKKK